MKFIIGLGNPGAQYLFTRHNVGFMCVDALFLDWKFPDFSKKFNAEYSINEFNGEKIILIKPQTFMNLSGKSVFQFLSFYKIKIDQVYVIHDDIESSFGEIKLYKNGGARGHNGIRSIDGLIGKDYFRLRIGVGRPVYGNVSDHVLSNFSKEEKEELPSIFNNVIKKVKETLIT